MSDYDFKNLSDKDFERLSADLLSLELGVRFERFKSGRDLGVDGRYFTHGKKEVTAYQFQARAVLKTGYTDYSDAVTFICT